MSFDDKVNEFLEKVEHEKIMIETQFADIESYIKDHDDIDYDKLVSILSHFNTLNIQYEQLCHDFGGRPPAVKKAPPVLTRPRMHVKGIPSGNVIRGEIVFD